MDAIAGHQIDFRTENILHALLDRDQVEQRETLRAIQIEEYIDVRYFARLITRNRTKKIERADTSIVKLSLVELEEADSSVAVDLSHSRRMARYHGAVQYQLWRQTTANPIAQP